MPPTDQAAYHSVATQDPSPPALKCTHHNLTVSKQRQRLHEFRLVLTRELADSRTEILSMTIVLLLFYFIFQSFG